MKISSRKKTNENIKLFISSILTIFIWKGIWTFVDDYIGVNKEINIILLLLSLIAIFFINGRIELY